MQASTTNGSRPIHRGLARALSGTARRLNGLAARLGQAALRRPAKPIDGPVLVHNMAKVGSKTIVNSLKAYDPGAEVLNTHYLTAQALADAEAKMEQMPGREWEHLDDSRRIRRRIQFESDAVRWRVVTLVRDPVARDVSYFFECLRIFWPQVRDQCAAGRLTVEQLSKLFLAHLNDDSPLQFVPRPLTWFDREMKPVFGIDVYAEPFAKERGYQIYAGPRADLLVMKLECISTCAAEAFAAFADIPNFKLVDVNTAGQKQQSQDTNYYALYNQFKQTVRLEQDYLQTTYSSKLVNHFYTEDDISRFKQTWSDRRAK